MEEPSKLRVFIQEQLQRSLELDEDEDCNLKGGIVVNWVVLIEVMPLPEGKREGPVLVALTSENQRPWITKGMLLDAQHMALRGDL